MLLMCKSVVLVKVFTSALCLPAKNDIQVNPCPLLVFIWACSLAFTLESQNYSVKSLLKWHHYFFLTQTLLKNQSHRVEFEPPDYLQKLLRSTQPVLDLDKYRSLFLGDALQKKGPRLKVTDACCFRWRYLLSFPGCRVMSVSFLQSLLLILQCLVQTLQTLRWNTGGEIVRDELKSIQCTGFWKILKDLCLNPPWASRPTVHFSSPPSAGRYPRPSLEHLSCSGNRL